MPFRVMYADHLDPLPVGRSRLAADNSVKFPFGRSGIHGIELSMQTPCAGMRTHRRIQPQ